MRCVVIQFILSIITWLSFTLILTCLSISFLDITNNYHLLEQEHLSEHYSSNIAWHGACNASNHFVYLYSLVLYYFLYLIMQSLLQQLGISVVMQIKRILIRDKNIII
jgi:hypothetical protein